MRGLEAGHRATLGRDFAGVVEGTGSGVGSLRAGDEVFGFLPHADPAVHDGTWAELIAVPEDRFVAPKPDGVDVAAAGAAPLVGITALAAFDALAPCDGETVLVVGATGGVGSVFVQLAAATGATVIAPARPEDEDYLREPGVRGFADRGSDLAPAVRESRPDGVDAILDVVSPSPDASLLKEGGRLASPLGAAGEGSGRFNLLAEPTQANLRRLAQLLDSGAVRVPIQRRYGLEQAGEALQAFSTAHKRGKLGLRLS